MLSTTMPCCARTCAPCSPSASNSTSLAGRLVDRPGRFVWEVLRSLVFRVSPSVPRVLDLLGLDPDHVWRLNRTQLVEALLSLDQHALAAYIAYYETCWRYFLSEWKDYAAGRDAVRCGVEVIELGIRVAEDWVAMNSGAIE